MLEALSNNLYVVNYLLKVRLQGPSKAKSYEVIRLISSQEMETKHH